LTDQPTPPSEASAPPTAAAKTYLRQPIVSVLGHVETSLLDRVRGGSVAKREAGAITQHIGATEVPLEALMAMLGPLGKGKKFSVPGLLFIDTPGHASFNALRARGGALADIAILVIDIAQGIQPQTVESIKILRRSKTPFVVAANKVDLLTGYQSRLGSFLVNFAQQTADVQSVVDGRLYKLIGDLGNQGLPADRYDRIADFTKSIALIPCSAKTGEGLADLLLVLIGLAQRFLEGRLETTEEGPAVGTVLEVKEERGLGLTVDAIVYGGTLRADDRIAFGGRNGPVVTQIRALLRPKPLDEIRDPREPFAKAAEAHAAAGVKIVAPKLEDVLPGAPLRVLRGRPDIEILDEIRAESEIQIPLDDAGVLIKADTMGSLEALASELKAKEVAIRAAGVGPVSRREVLEVALLPDPTDRVILAFNVPLLPDAVKEAADRELAILQSDVIYHLLDAHAEWRAEAQRKKDLAERVEITHPGVVKYLEGYTFRTSNPAVVGMRVLAGQVKPGQHLLKEDGRVLGPIKSLQSEGKPVAVAHQGQELAVAIDGATVGRQIKEGEVLYVDLTGHEARALFAMTKLSPDERDALEKVARVKRRTDRFWGT
jgi:translation initiation factor 5B